MQEVEQPPVKELELQFGVGPIDQQFVRKKDDARGGVVEVEVAAAAAAPTPADATDADRASIAVRSSLVVSRPVGSLRVPTFKFRNSNRVP